MEVVQEKIMKRYLVAVLLSGFTFQAGASEIIPPRIAVKWLIEAAQNTNRTSSVAYHFTFEKKKHHKLTPLSRNEQVAILKTLEIAKLKFDRDEYHVDEGKRFVVKLLAPEMLEFDIETVELKGEIGPPVKYAVIAIRRTTQPPLEINSQIEPGVSDITKNISSSVCDGISVIIAKHDIRPTYCDGPSLITANLKLDAVGEYTIHFQHPKGTNQPLVDLIVTAQSEISVTNVFKVRCPATITNRVNDTLVLEWRGRPGRGRLSGGWFFKGIKKRK